MMRAGGLFVLGVLGTTFVTACGSGSTSLLAPVGPTDVRCGVTIVPTPSTVSAAGGTGTLKIGTARECRWSVSGSAAWLTFKAPVEGQGPADVPFAVESNPSTEPRRIELVVADQRAVISQEAATCSWKVTPEAVTAGAAGGEVRATLAAEDYCSWTAAPKAPWMEVTSDDSGTGPTEIAVRIAGNSGAERSGTVEFAPGVVLVIRQQAVAAAPAPPAPAPPGPATPPAPCTFNVTPSRFDNVVPGPSDLFVDVSTGATCAWTASSAANWVTESPAAATGIGRVRLSVLSNTGGNRSAAVIIAGRTVNVSQIACTYTVNPTSLNLNRNAQTSSINVTTNSPACAVTAVSNRSWIRVGAFPPAGGGNIPLTVDSNSGSRRSATITIGGSNNFSRAVRVDQDDH